MLTTKQIRVTKLTFGYGTLNLVPLVSESGVKLSIQPCERMEIGAKVPDSKKLRGDKVVLEFRNKDSIDVLIQKLKYLKSELE